MTFGPGVRAQVFEVIVRQAISGAPWREICAGPMQVNNITPEEVEFEVDRRLNVGKEYLPAEKHAALTEYFNQWENSITSGSNVPQSQIQIDDLVADLYELHDLKRPTVIACESPAKLLFYLTHLSLRSADFRLDPLIQSTGRSQFDPDIDLALAQDQNEFFRSHLASSLKDLPRVTAEGLGDPVTAKMRSGYLRDLAANLDAQMKGCLDTGLCSYFKWGVRHQTDRFLQRLGTAIDVTVNSLPSAAFDASFASEPNLIESEVRPLLGDAVNNFVRDIGNRFFRTQFESLASISPVSAMTADTFRLNLFGIWQATDLLSYAFVQEQLGDSRLFSAPQDKQLSTFVGMFRAAPWYSFFQNFCFVGAYPQSRVYDEQFRLSNREGPAIAFADGYQIFAVEGIVAPRKLIESPETITVSDIDQTVNVAIRRFLIETYGTARFLTDSGAALVHKDEFGELYRKELPGDEALMMVCVTNSTIEADGTYKRYFLRVPPNTRTAQEAVAWTFGMTSPQYRPATET